MLDMLCVLTTPADLHAIGLAPFAGDPGDPVTFCCFFRDSGSRDAFLAKLRDVAATPPTVSESDEARTARLADQYTHHWRRGAPDEALTAAIEWRAHVSKRGYHTYSLREGFPPFRSGCIVTFEPLGAAELHAQFDQAVEVLSAEQGQVMDVFGWGISPSSPEEDWDE